MKKFSLLLLCILLLGVLVACNDQKTGKTNTTESQETSGTQGTQVTENVVLYDADGVHCCLVYPNGASSTVRSYVERIQATFKTVTGAELSAYTESDAPNDGSVAIYFGNTRAAGVKNIPSDAGYYNYLISVRDGNVYVYAMDEKILTEALAKFNLNLPKRFADGVLALDENFLYQGTVSTYKLLSYIPYFDNGSYHSTHDCYNGHEMVLIRNADTAEFNAYCQKIESKGYTLTAENDMNGNLFRTYFNSKGIMLHTYLVKYSGEVRVIVADNPTYCNTQPENAETYQSFLVPVPMDGGGMGYVIRLGDGSFILVDSGNPGDGKKVYNLLKQYAPDPNNIVISTWIFTHGHGDHVGGFLDFAPVYANDPTITVKSFMHNMCLSEEQTKYMPTKLWQDTINAMNQYYPTAPVYIALTGQTYNFANAQIEIFFTMSDFMPKTIENEPDATEADPLKGDANIQSVVFRLNINGTSVFMMADTTTVCCDEMSDRYGSYLKSDYVQMAHHGIENLRAYRAQNATKEIYGLIAPDYALLPCDSKVATTRLKYDVNKYLLELIGGEDNVICSDTNSKVVYFLAS